MFTTCLMRRDSQMLPALSCAASSKRYFSEQLGDKLTQECKFILTLDLAQQHLLCVNCWTRPKVLKLSKTQPFSHFQKEALMIASDVADIPLAEGELKCSRQVGKRATRQINVLKTTQDESRWAMLLKICVSEHENMMHHLLLRSCSSCSSPWNKHANTSKSLRAEDLGGGNGALCQSLWGTVTLGEQSTSPPLAPRLCCNSQSGHWSTWGSL